MNTRTCFSFFVFVAMAISPALSQAQTPLVVAQRVNLATSASVQVAQDLLTLSLSVVREGNDAHLLQKSMLRWRLPCNWRAASPSQG